MNEGIINNNKITTQKGERKEGTQKGRGGQKNEVTKYVYPCTIER